MTLLRLEDSTSTSSPAPSSEGTRRPEQERQLDGGEPGQDVLGLVAVAAEPENGTRDIADLLPIATSILRIAKEGEVVDEATGLVGPDLACSPTAATEFINPLPLPVSSPAPTTSIPVVKPLTLQEPVPVNPFIQGANRHHQIQPRSASRNAAATTSVFHPIYSYVHPFATDTSSEFSSSVTCQLCLEVYSSPIRLPCCAQLLCSTCVRRWIRVKHTCPWCVCEVNEKALKVDREVKGLVEDLDVHCAHRRQGCNWIGPRKYLLVHVAKECVAARDIAERSENENTLLYLSLVDDPVGLQNAVMQLYPRNTSMEPNNLPTRYRGRTPVPRTRHDRSLSDEDSGSDEQTDLFYRSISPHTTSLSIVDTIPPRVASAADALPVVYPGRPAPFKRAGARGSVIVPLRTRSASGANEVSGKTGLADLLDVWAGMNSSSDAGPTPNVPNKDRSGSISTGSVSSIPSAPTSIIMPSAQPPILAYVGVPQTLSEPPMSPPPLASPISDIEDPFEDRHFRHMKSYVVAQNRQPINALSTPLMSSRSLSRDGRVIIPPRESSRSPIPRRRHSPRPSRLSDSDTDQSLS
ncbi:hypothetical protein DFS34DRAFT_646966 [Phlyctochytrium arcticum]|nr:hypothetical protein DFS34DRAFT_646966 [Phlyctochytrium arcticum]